MTLSYGGVVKRIQKGKVLGIVLDEVLNEERLKTIQGMDEEYQVCVTFEDARLATTRQRNFVKAILTDIAKHTGMTRKESRDAVYQVYSGTYEEDITLATDANTSMSDANALVEICLEVAFELGVKFNPKLQILPSQEESFFFLCCKYRRCAVCQEEHADIDHVETVGRGANRRKHDHTKHTFMALCRKHHNERHNIGIESFLEKHHVTPVKINDETLVRLGLMTQKQIDEL